MKALHEQGRATQADVMIVEYYWLETEESLQAVKRQLRASDEQSPDKAKRVPQVGKSVHSRDEAVSPP